MKDKSVSTLEIRIKTWVNSKRKERAAEGKKVLDWKDLCWIEFLNFLSFSFFSEDDDIDAAFEAAFKSPPAAEQPAAVKSSTSPADLTTAAAPEVKCKVCFGVIAVDQDVFRTCAACCRKVCEDCSTSYQEATSKVSRIYLTSFC